MISETNLPSISIVILTYNEEKNIRTCLGAILSQNYLQELVEIIIVDNKSTGTTVKIIKEYMRKA
jgi:glycosyltransferase involved in cell wall biosynthesis